MVAVHGSFFSPNSSGLPNRRTHLGLSSPHLSVPQVLELTPGPPSQWHAQVLEFLEGGDLAGELVLGGVDGWGRLLVHSLAEYYGLLSASRPASAATAASLPSVAEEGQQGEGAVAVYHRPQVRCTARCLWCQLTWFVSKGDRMLMLDNNL